jgi:hypothetical protein
MNKILAVDIPSTLSILISVMYEAHLFLGFIKLKKCNEYIWGIIPHFLCKNSPIVDNIPQCLLVGTPFGDEIFLLTLPECLICTILQTESYEQGEKK